MGKQIIITEQMVGNEWVLGSNSLTIPLRGKVIAVSITNMDVSPERLLIGWNENASTKNYLNQGESRPYGPFRDGDYLQGNELRLAFETSDPNNQGLVSIMYETDQEVC